MQPTPNPDAGPAAGSAPRVGGCPGRRVLVVDDSHLFRTVLVRLLEAGGYDVAVAVNGGEAVALMAGADAVVLDLELPGLEGTRALAALGRLMRRPVPHRRPSVVALVGTPDPAVIDRLRSLGVQQVLVKTFIGAADVCRAVETALPSRPLMTAPAQRPAA